MISRKDVESALQNYLASQDFSLEKYEFRTFSDGNLGFMGRHFKITTWVTFEGSSRQIDFFAKLAPTSRTHQTARTTSNYFTKEVFTYAYLAPKLDACLLPRAKFPVPRCFLSRDAAALTPPSEDRRLLLLEDVSRLNFRLLEDVQPLDLAHCRAVLRSLARFHASSLLLQESLVGDGESNTLREVAKEVFRSDFLNWMSGMNWAFNCARSMATAAALIWTERFDAAKESVLIKLNEAWERVYAMAYASDKYANVLCHADLWINNMMFSYEKNPEGKEVPVDVVFVDLQFVHYTPPTLDLLLFLHLCTRREFRDENWRDLLEYYHTEIGKYVSTKTLETRFPFTSLLESFEEFREYGRLKSIGYLPTVLEGLVPREQLDEQEPDVLEGMLKDRGHQIFRYCKASEAYRTRIEESFQECLEGLNLWI
ncbi:uncharacterized protein [Hetaerina americana]|uniref:uncharacterized protein n=1 Tax=Hetaerina americana TaxID=62018 RepID=UPI003A7F46E4